MKVLALHRSLDTNGRLGKIVGTTPHKPPGSAIPDQQKIFNWNMTNYRNNRGIMLHPPLCWLSLSVKTLIYTSVASKLLPWIQRWVVAKSVVNIFSTTHPFFLQFWDSTTVPTYCIAVWPYGYYPNPIECQALAIGAKLKYFWGEKCMGFTI